MRHPVHEAVHRIHRVVRVADRARTGFAELDDALCAAAGEAVAVVGHACERIEADRLRRDVDPLHGVVERSEEHTSELQSLMRISYSVFCVNKKLANRCIMRMSIISLSTTQHLGNI